MRGEKGWRIMVELDFWRHKDAIERRMKCDAVLNEGNP